RMTLRSLEFRPDGIRGPPAARRFRKRFQGPRDRFRTRLLRVSALTPIAQPGARFPLATVASTRAAFVLCPNARRFALPEKKCQPSRRGARPRATLRSLRQRRPRPSTAAIPSLKSAVREGRNSPGARFAAWFDKRSRRR